MSFFSLLGAMKGLTYECARSGCNKLITRGYEFDGGKICEECGKEFNDTVQSIYHRDDHAHAKCRKYVDADLQVFLKTSKGHKFEPSKPTFEDVAVYSHDVFYRKQVEVLKDSDEESSEDSFDLRLKKIDEEHEARYRKFQNNPEFVTKFRAKLFYCSDEVLISLIRAGEAHALVHKLEEKCDECGDDCDVIEMSHHTRGLGTLWLETVKETYENHEERLNEIAKSETLEEIKDSDSMSEERLLKIWEELKADESEKRYRFKCPTCGHPDGSFCDCAKRDWLEIHMRDKKSTL